MLESAHARTLLPVARLWRRAADRALSDMDLSAASGWALVQIGRLGGNVRQGDLARELDVTAGSLVRVVNQLVATELVERSPDSVDGRVSRLDLTEKGDVLRSRIETVFGALRHKILAGITDAELEIAVKVAEHLEAGFLRDWH